MLFAIVWIKGIFYKCLVFYCTEWKILTWMCVRHSYFHLFFLTLPVSCMSLSFNFQYTLCVGEKEVLQTTLLSIVLFHLLKTLHVVVFTVFLISVKSLLWLVLGFSLLNNILCNCVLLISWSRNVFYVQVL